MLATGQGCDQTMPGKSKQAGAKSRIPSSRTHGRAINAAIPSLLQVEAVAEK